ncbi:MAG: tetratricopeptide repeat protein, partial [Planctomycetota bacterium]
MRFGKLHLQLADEDFDGVEKIDDLGRPVKTRNVPRALASYRHALEVGVPEAEETRVRERIARALEETGQAAPAAAEWNRLLDEVEKGKIEATDEQKERWLVGRARARLAAGQRDAARKDLRDALEAHPRGKLHMEILLLLGEERLQAAGGSGNEVVFEEGVTWIRRAILEHRDDERAAGAQKRLAEAYERRSQSEKAAAEWGAFVERFPLDEFVPEARDRHAEALSRAGRYDEAIATWERYLAAHPNHRLWQQVREKIVATAFAKGALQMRADDAEGAIAAWRGFAQKYPTDARAPQALLLAGMALREKKDAEAALGLWRQIAGRYAASAHAPQALLLVALTLEEDLQRLDDAVKAYEDLIQKHGNTGQAGEARVRLQRLKSKHLQLRMERVVGTGEKPTFRAVTRNVEGLDIRIYHLEIEEYFRRKGTVLGVENLQLEVVKPDATHRWNPEAYAPFALTEADVQVPVEGAGAYVIVAGDEDLTATLLFLVSDAEIVVKKAQRRQLLVWAFDRGDQTPLAGARILAAEGDKVIEVGETGADGVWHGEQGDEATHVLVLTDQGPAATELEAGPVTASGFQSKAYIYTAQPVYRPGQTVNWRAVFLRASGGSYVAPRQVKGVMKVLDARGQQLLEEEVTSTEFGTFAGSFPLDGAAALGAYKIEIHVRNVGRWSGPFEVQEYRKPEFTLELEPAQPVYLTGETVKATAHLRYAFGGVVANAPLRYEVYRQPRVFELHAVEDYGWYFRDDRPDEEAEVRPAAGRVLVARGTMQTDDGGEAVIEFETAEKDEDAEYVVRVAVEDVTRRWIVDEGRIPVTRRDHMAVVKADRQVYRP